jgi:hypothetical protein
MASLVASGQPDFFRRAALQCKLRLGHRNVVFFGIEEFRAKIRARIIPDCWVQMRNVYPDLRSMIMRFISPRFFFAARELCDAVGICGQLSSLL